MKCDISYDSMKAPTVMTGYGCMFYFFLNKFPTFLLLYYFIGSCIFTPKNLIAIWKCLSHAHENSHSKGVFFKDNFKRKKIIRFWVYIKIIFEKNICILTKPTVCVIWNSHCKKLKSSTKQNNSKSLLLDNLTSKITNLREGEHVTNMRPTCFVTLF